jgi:hypothetical protein
MMTSTPQVAIRPKAGGSYVLTWQTRAMPAPAFEDHPNRYEAAQHALALLFGTPPDVWRVECFVAPDTTLELDTADPAVPRDPRERVLHRHGAWSHKHEGSVGFTIGGQVVPDRFPETDGHRHGWREQSAPSAPIEPTS